MKKILFPLFAILFLGLVLNCSAVPDKNPYLQRQWMLVSFAGFSKDQLIAHKAEMNLTGKLDNGKIQGNAYMGCNQMSFTSEFKKDGIVKISQGISTMKACQDMNLESSFQKKIETMTKYSVEGHFLTLSDNQGNTMKFVAADWD
ncbi:META domain-containing protein [Chryseobacterium sp. BIGb0232]|uniref:META domain-containing protein n=1 Tax=Chryseobacterium sp. BIGb0232 TaxID=2940598 RepID=UPI000FBBE2D7|nr:META domain-containing protein [Chryseobacterium sp. BIGb0232]MCS4304475.1 heat shock protein HslJ [Chryseobacterium sp. BIGb0232]ROS14388.1 heat shock protein HslJ [Chryseobacterium nakagawai]